MNRKSRNLSDNPCIPFFLLRLSLPENRREGKRDRKNYPEIACTHACLFFFFFFFPLSVVEPLFFLSFAGGEVDFDLATVGVGVRLIGAGFGFGLATGGVAVGTTVGLGLASGATPGCATALLMSVEGDAAGEESGVALLMSGDGDAPGEGSGTATMSVAVARNVRYPT